MIRSFFAILAALAVSAGVTMAADNQSTGKEMSFIHKAAVGGMTEVKMGELAQKQAQMQGVKDFGQRLVQDHTQANQELMALAQKKGWALPQQLDEKHQQMVTKMGQYQGANFDQHFLKDAVNDHEKDIKEFEEEAKKTSDPDLKAWIQKTLPTLREHLRIAKELSGHKA